jgi:hypothetical protein
VTHGVEESSLCARRGMQEEGIAIYVLGTFV